VANDLDPLQCDSLSSRRHVRLIKRRWSENADFLSGSVEPALGGVWNLSLSEKIAPSGEIIENGTTPIRVKDFGKFRGTPTQDRQTDLSVGLREREIVASRVQETSFL